MKRGSMADFARYIARQSAEAVALPGAVAKIAAPVMTEGVKEQFGHAPPLADLAESTQDERTSLGYTPNDPLLRSGGLQDSFEPAVIAEPARAIAVTGSKDLRAAWHEHGYINARTGTPVPPRPVVLLGATETEPLLKTLWRNGVRRVATE